MRNLLWKAHFSIKYKNKQFSLDFNVSSFSVIISIEPRTSIHILEIWMTNKEPLEYLQYINNAETCFFLCVSGVS